MYSSQNRFLQVASARFGVTSPYLSNADELQIKMAQVVLASDWSRQAI